MSSENSKESDIAALRRDLALLINATLNDQNIPDYFKEILRDSLFSGNNGALNKSYGTEFQKGVE